MLLKKSVSLVVRGKQNEWAVPCDMHQGQIDAMRADGFDIEEPIYTIPVWVAEIGLARPWCFVQDVWALRNPFSK